MIAKGLKIMPAYFPDALSNAVCIYINGSYLTVVIQFLFILLFIVETAAERHGTVDRQHIKVLNYISFQLLRGSLHESGLSYNPDRTQSVSVEIIGD